MIEELTPAQIASLPAEVEEWMGIGIDTRRLDYTQVKKAVTLAYEIAELTPPRFYMYVDGPWAASECDLTEEDFIRLSNSADPKALTNAVMKYVDPTKPTTNIKNGFCGQHDAGWLSFYNFFHKHFGICEKVVGLCELAKTVGRIYLYQDLVIVCEKPTSVVMVNGRTHNEKGPSIAYADGLEVYSFNGVVIPKKWVVERDTMDPSEILSHRDTDQRAAGIALFGYARMKHKLGYKILDGDPTTDIGALIELAIPGLENKGHFLEAICPRNGPVFLGIPRENPFDGGRQIRTAVAAQAFLAGLPESAYAHPPIRT